MKQEKTMWGYAFFLLGEGFFRLRKELSGWRGAAVLFIFGYMALDMFWAEDTEFLASLEVAAIWLMLLFPPRIGTLLYLLPFSKVERRRYLGSYAAVYMVFLVLTFLLVGTVSSLLLGYPYPLWILYFVCTTVPLLMAYSGSFLTNAVKRKQTDSMDWLFFSTRGWWKQSVNYIEEAKELCKAQKPAEHKRKKLMPQEKKERRKCIFRGSAILVSVIVVTIHACGGWIWKLFGLDETLAFLAGTIIAYVCATVVILVCIRLIAEKLDSTGGTGKEEGGCNS